MPLIFITGISTAGKSAVAEELSQRGYEAYDTEHDGISAWHDKKSGQRVAEMGKMPQRTKEWLSEHEWLISIDWVSKIARKAKLKPIFLCGGSANERNVRAMCDIVIFLKTDEATIHKRVVNLRDHDYGTKAHELTLIIESNQQKEAEYHQYGAIMIDATRSIDEVIDEILEKAAF